MVGKEILNGVYEFIKNNPNRNQSDIVRGLKGVCTRLPVLDAIRELTSDKDGREPKVEFSRNTRKGSYLYYVNDKNEYNKLVTQIEQTYKGIEMVIGLVNSNFDGSERLRLEYHSGFKFLSLVHFAQLVLNNKIVKIAQAIDQKIKSNTDREILYSQLIQLLLISSKLNTELIPFVSIDFSQTLSQIKDSKIRKEKILQFYQVEDTLTKIMLA
jgi:hypothetical protein